MACAREATFPVDLLSVYHRNKSLIYYYCLGTEVTDFDSQRYYILQLLGLQDNEYEITSFLKFLSLGPVKTVMIVSLRSRTKQGPS